MIFCCTFVTKEILDIDSFTHDLREFIYFFIYCIYTFCIVLTAPSGLSEIVNFDQYLEDKFGVDFLRENITNGVLSVGEYLHKGRIWSGDNDNSAENSMINGSIDNSAELLSVCMKELKLKNKWTREVAQK